MITGVQIKAARALLGWSVGYLARRAAITIADAQDVEDATKVPRRRLADAAAIQQALEEAGIKFIDSVGVQLSPPWLKSVADQVQTPTPAGCELNL